MQIPSEAFEAVGYCLLSVKSINNKFSICETDVSGMSDTSSDSSSNMLSISDSISNMLSISDSSSNVLSISDTSPLELSVSDIDISDIEFSDIEKFYFADIKIHEEKEKEKEKYIDKRIDFHEFFYILSTIIESFVFEETTYLFDIFV